MTQYMRQYMTASSLQVKVKQHKARVKTGQEETQQDKDKAILGCEEK
jgi:hypothetical protein